jgi:small subunit ribosomal protein S18
MARNNDRDRGAPKRGPKPNDRRPAKKKPSPIVEGTYVDYKDIVLLRKFMSDRGKIKARRVTGLSVQVQRDIAVAIKTARELALLPYATRTSSERGPRRGPRRDKDAGPATEGNATDNDVTADEVDTEDVEV